MYTEDDLKDVAEFANDALDKLEQTLSSLEHYQKLFYISCAMLDHIAPLDDTNWSKYIIDIDKNFNTKRFS